MIHDTAYLGASGALPNYDRSIVVPEKTLADMAERWAASTETGILGSGSLTKYMPTTGGRPEIGPYPNWTVQYLLSMDPRAKAIVLGNGDLAGSWPIHVRSSRNEFSKMGQAPDIHAPEPVPFSKMGGHRASVPRSQSRFPTS